VSTRIRTGVAVEQGNEDLPDSDNSFFGGRVDDLLLAAEVPLDRARRHSCGGDDVVHRCGVEAVTREAAPGTGEDVLAALGARGVAEATITLTDVSKHNGRCTCRGAPTHRRRRDVVIAHIGFDTKQGNNRVVQGRRSTAQQEGTDMSDIVGHDGPSGAGDDGPGVITVNGLRMWVGDNVTVALLLESLGYPARGVAVALNRAVLPRSAWQTKLSDGARLEVLTAVQGSRC
jgi:sulfur carrier protein